MSLMSRDTRGFLGFGSLVGVAPGAGGGPMGVLRLCFEPAPPEADDLPDVRPATSSILVPESMPRARSK